MKLNIPVAAIVSIILLSSCSSVYRSGQTPDDVYYSPTRPGTSVARHNSDDDDEYTYTNPDDNYLRQKVQNRNRWSSIDDADYWYSYNRPYSNLYNYSPYNSLYNSPYGYNGLSLGLGNYYGSNCFGGYPFWNNYGYNNYGYSNYGYGSYGNTGYYGHGYYGGYYPGTVIVNNLRSNTGPKPYMGSYTNGSFSNTNNSRGENGRFIQTTNGRSSQPAYNNSNNNYSTPSRTFTPSSSSSGSSGGGSSRSTGSSGGGGRSGRGGR